MIDSCSPNKWLWSLLNSVVSADYEGTPRPATSKYDSEFTTFCFYCACLVICASIPASPQVSLTPPSGCSHAFSLLPLSSSRLAGPCASLSYPAIARATKPLCETSKLICCSTETGREHTRLKGKGGKHKKMCRILEHRSDGARLSVRPSPILMSHEFMAVTRCKTDQHRSKPQ